jgi:ribosomal protein S14
VLNNGSNTNNTNDRAHKRFPAVAGVDLFWQQRVRIINSGDSESLSSSTIINRVFVDYVSLAIHSHANDETVAKKKKKPGLIPGRCTPCNLYERVALYTFQLCRACARRVIIVRAPRAQKRVIPVLAEGDRAARGRKSDRKD